MRFNKAWIDTLVPNAKTADELSDIITMAGLEVDTVDDVAGVFNNVVIGEVLTCADHPDSDHLHVTTINVGTEVLDIVCGAPNCRAGLKVACAKVGAVLPGDFKIKPAKLRGVPSNGMLCSYKELGLAEESNGIIELPSDAPVGTDLREYFALNDKAIEVDLTANRADCLSIRGLAREIGVLLKTDVIYPEIKAVTPEISDVFPVEIEDKAAAPRYISRVIKGLDTSKPSPIWMQERLRRAGIRSIDAIVDVTNYVMLELGQPMHAFDLASLRDKIVVRKAKNGETLTLLSGAEAKLKDDTLVIADAEGVAALAGIFGGSRTGVQANSADIVLEAAYFAPSAIKNRAREYGLATDASHRFERGVDFEITAIAMERATAYLLDICGGKAGPLNEVFNKEFLPSRNKIVVPYDLINSVIGIDIEKATVLDILARLGLAPIDNGEAVEVTSPSWRYDIAIPVDICEEVARIYGYDNIPNLEPVAPLRMIKQPENKITTYKLKSLLADIGYHEIVTYSFVEPNALKTINPAVDAIMIPSPISADMSAMRTTLWTGLINTVVYNINRQMNNIKLFETGLTFIPDTNAENGIRQEEMIGGILNGNTNDEIWNTANRAFDFYDLKGDVEALIATTAQPESFTFQRCDIPALHPGVSAALYKDNECVGYLGLIHPSIQKKLGLKHAVYLFEIKMSALGIRKLPSYKEVSKYPSIRRDLAIVLDKSISYSDVLASIKKNGGNKIVDEFVFDVYQGANLPDNKKSIAVGIVMQDTEKTLEESEVTTAIDNIVKGLATDLGAVLRD